MKRFFNSVEWEGLIDSDSSLSRILWAIRNVLYLQESYGDRVDADHRRASLLELADDLDEIKLAQMRESLTHEAVG